MRLAVFDLEMTGLSPERDRIVEIGIVQAEGFVEVARWSSLVRSSVPVGTSERVHGISDAMLQDAPTLASLASTLSEQLAGATLVAHRAFLDIAFLKAAMERGEIASAPIEVIDTAVIASRVFGESSSRVLAERIGGRMPAHRAVPDALAALDVLAACVDALGPIEANELVALSGEQASMRAEVERLLRAGPTNILYRPASGRVHEDIVRVESLSPPYVTGVLEKKGVRRVLRGDRIVRAWIGERPTMRFF